MTRAPFQVLVYAYRKNVDGLIEFALMKRSVEGFWQGVSGGGEDDETIIQAAKRETFEETGITPSIDFLQLNTIESIPITAFTDSHIWGKDVYVIPQYCFGFNATDFEIKISNEHSEYGWFLYEQALHLLKFDGNKTALWELNQRLLGRGSRATD